MIPVSRNLGYLMPRPSFREWDFAESEDPEPVAEELAAAAQTFGLPFLDEWADWPTFMARLPVTDLVVDVKRVHLVPMAWAADGRPDLAAQALRAELDQLAGDESLYAVKFRAFADAFSARYLQPT